VAAVLRAFVGYLFLVFVMRIVGRRPGKQKTPHEFVLIFFIGGLALTAIVGNDASFTNALIQILAIAFAHYCLVLFRSLSSRFTRIADGIPLVLLENHQWKTEVLKKMRIQDDDVMAMAREQGLKTLDQIDRAILERDGEISIARIKKAS
jgi:uncharacterized membrane protein YcaP (DUF421 family)